MRVFVTGASGFVGSAVVAELIQAGHTVVGLARSSKSAAAIEAAGAEAHPGSLEDFASLRAAVAKTDGVIHTAYNHDDFTRLAESAKVDREVVALFGDELAGSGRPFVVTSGLAVFPSGHRGTEDEPGDPASAGVHRVPSEDSTVALAERGVRSMVVRLPPSVHGDGDRGFVPALIGIAREKGVSGYVGEGLNRWPAVHRFDAARLFRLALEKGAAGSRFHAVGDEGVPVREIAEVIGRRLGLPVESRPVEHFGWLGHFLAGDFPATGALTRERLGWRPEGGSLLEDLEQGSYL